MTTTQKGNVTDLQSAMAFDYVLGHRSGACPESMSEKWPGKTLEAQQDYWTSWVLILIQDELRQMRDASAKAKLVSETWWKYWDRVWANKRLPGETPKLFVMRMKNPQTINITEARFMQMRDHADAHKLADEQWWEYWERTAVARKLPGESWSQYWIRTVVQ